MNKACTKRREESFSLLKLSIKVMANHLEMKSSKRTMKIDKFPS